MPAAKVTDRAEPAVVPNGVAPPLKSSRLPPLLRVPILVVLSLSLRLVLLSAATPFISDELRSISRPQGDVTDALAHLGYKILVLWLGWQAKYDFRDISSLTVLANAPYAHLITAYYSISPTTAATLIAIEILSTALPTALLRPLSAVHNPNAQLYNRFLLRSFKVQTTTTALLSSVYALTLWTISNSPQIRAFLVTHFDIPTIEAAHASTPLAIITRATIIGYAAQAFLLNASLGAQSSVVTPVQLFDPATSTLADTLQHNFWFWSKRTKTLIKQTVIASIFLFATTAEHALTLQGTEKAGAVGYAAVWVLATVISAGWAAYVGDT